MRFKIYRDKKGEFRWKLLAKNGKVVADCAEGYKRERDLLHAIELIILMRNPKIIG